MKSVGSVDGIVAAQPTNLPGRNGRLQLTAANLAVADALNVHAPGPNTAGSEPLRLFEYLDTAWAADPAASAEAHMSYIRGEIRRFNQFMSGQH